MLLLTRCVVVPAASSLRPVLARRALLASIPLLLPSPTPAASDRVSFDLATPTGPLGRITVSLEAANPDASRIFSEIARGKYRSRCAGGDGLEETNSRILQKDQLEG